MENLIKTNIVKGKSRGETIESIKRESVKYFVGLSDYGRGDMVSNAKSAFDGDSAANKTTIAILNKNEGKINTALSKLGKPTTGTVVAKSVRLYNAATSKNFAGALLSLITDPAVITAIISIVAFFVSKTGKKGAALETAVEQDPNAVTANNINGAEWVTMLKDFLSGKTNQDFKSNINNLTLLIIGAFAVLLVIVFYVLYSKK